MPYMASIFLWQITFGGRIPILWVKQLDNVLKSGFSIARQGNNIKAHTESFARCVGIQKSPITLEG